MNTAQAQLLRDKLMEGVPPDLIVKADASITRTLEKLEPVIDAMLEAARAGSNPVDWTLADALFEFLPNGASIIVTITIGIRKFNVLMDRTRMESLGQTLIRASGA